jgi:hypothetical protein
MGFLSLALLRSFRLGPIALFDLLAAFAGTFAVLAYVHDWRGNHGAHALVSVVLALSLGTAAHVALGISTPITRALSGLPAPVVAAMALVPVIPP